MLKLVRTRSKTLGINRLFITASILLKVFLLISFLYIPILYADSKSIDSANFDDFPLKHAIENPAWFKLSFLELKVDIEEAKENNKSGVLLYFGQKRCPYCKKFIDDNFTKKDVLKYVKANFDVIGIDVRGTKTVVDFNNKELSEREFAVQQKANFTPTLIFYNLRGQMILKLVGYQSPYRFRAAMEYARDKHYTAESFRDYLSRAKKDLTDKLAGLNKQNYFSPPPFKLDRRKVKNAKPLMVFFEQGNCHACDVLHTGPLMNFKTKKRMRFFEVVQLNMWADTQIVTPKGKKLTAKKWAEKLNINYAPTLIVFDKQGNEIIRAGSVVHFFRLSKIISYVLDQGYKKFGNYRAWRMSSTSQ